GYAGTEERAGYRSQYRRRHRYAAVDAPGPDAPDGAGRRYVRHRRHLSGQGKQQPEPDAVRPSDSNPRSVVPPAELQLRTRRAVDLHHTANREGVVKKDAVQSKSVCSE